MKIASDFTPITLTLETLEEKENFVEMLRYANSHMQDVNFEDFKLTHEEREAIFLANCRVQKTLQDLFDFFDNSGSE